MAASVRTGNTGKPLQTHSEANPATSTQTSPTMSAQELRRLLRIALGSGAGFALCKLMNWPFGVFFTVYPMLLLGMLPLFNRLIALQFIAGVAINALEISLLQLFKPYPLVMTLAVMAVFGLHFYQMARGRYYLMWASGLVTLSTLLHFGSYPQTVLGDMLMATLMAALVTVISAALLYRLVPETEPVSLPVRPEPTAQQLRHRLVLCSLLATLSFVVFQVADLMDSLSAQVSTLLVLFPMSYQGVNHSSITRAKGLIAGCALALGMQLLIYDLSHHSLLVLLSFFLCVLLTARLHLLERAGSGVGFGALTTIGILFGQYMQPGQDIVYSTAYRLSSVLVALAVLLLIAGLLHRLMNRVPALQDR